MAVVFSLCIFTISRYNSNDSVRSVASAVNAHRTLMRTRVGRLWVERLRYYVARQHVSDSWTSREMKLHLSVTDMYSYGPLKHSSRPLLIEKFHAGSLSMTNSLNMDGSALLCFTETTQWVFLRDRFVVPFETPYELLLAIKVIGASQVGELIELVHPSRIRLIFSNALKEWFV